MNRDEKAAAIQDLTENLSSSEAVFAIDYRGISVSQAAELRRKLRENDAVFKVSKNRLAKMAASQAEREELQEFLTGPTALTFVKGDAAAVAKAVSEFSKEHDVLAFKGGLLGTSVIDEAAFTSIAKLPSRDALNAQLAGVVATPLTGLVRGLGSLVSGLAVALQQVADQGLVGANAPATDAKGEASDSEAPQAADEEPPAAESADETSDDSNQEQE